MTLLVGAPASRACSGRPTVTTEPPTSQFLTVAEVADQMRVSKMTVYRLVHSGELPAVRVGKSFRVPQRALSEYLASAFYEADQISS